MITLDLSRPWLWADLGEHCNVLSWAPANPWLTKTRHVAWREVRNADLTVDFDAAAWLQSEITACGKPDAVAMLTSRNVTRFRHESAVSGLIRADCVATVGLSNAERIGHRQGQAKLAGTINLLVRLSAGLAPPAMLEAATIAAQARTAAVMDFGPDVPQGKATGTGTDCIAIAAPAGGAIHAGLHTEIGEAVGRAVYDAVSAGTRDWMANGGKDV